MFTNSQHLQFDGIHGGIQITHILSRAMEIVLSDIFQIPDNKFNEEKTFQCVAMTVLSGSLFIPILTHSLPNCQILFSPQTPTDPQLLPRRVLTWPKTPSKSNKSHLRQKLSTISLGEKIRNKPEELTKLECRVWLALHLIHFKSTNKLGNSNKKISLALSNMNEILKQRQSLLQ